MSLNCLFFQSNNKGADDNPDDSSAASIKSSNGGAITKKSSRMVKVDYSSKNGGPQPLRDPNSNNDNDNQGNCPWRVGGVVTGQLMTDVLHACLVLFGCSLEGNPAM